MRKQSRQLDAATALEIFDNAAYVTVSMTRPDGTPYGLPLSLVRIGDNRFYFHCALEGEKLDCIRANPVVSLSAVTKCRPTMYPDGSAFTLEYRSAIALGRAEIVSDEAEKISALQAICLRFLPEHMDAFDAAVARSLPITTIVRITLLEPPVAKHREFV